MFYIQEVLNLISICEPIRMHHMCQSLPKLLIWSLPLLDVTKTVRHCRRATLRLCCYSVITEIKSASDLKQNRVCCTFFENKEHLSVMSIYNKVQHLRSSS